MSSETESPQQQLVKLRQRILDLQKLDPMDPTAFGTYQQTLLQILNEAERRRQSCLKQAASLEQQAASARSQASAFQTMGSVMYSVVNGFAVAEEKRVLEETQREAEKKQEEEEASESAAASEAALDDKPKKKGRSKARKTK
jgi:hypothetical protein